MAWQNAQKPPESIKRKHKFTFPNHLTARQPQSHARNWCMVLQRVRQICGDDSEQLRCKGIAVRRGLGRSPEQLLARQRSEEHTSELQSHSDLVCRLLL